MRHLEWTVLALVLAITGAGAQQQAKIAPPQPAGKVGTDVPGITAVPVVNETLAVQVMLDRLGFSPGEIDGRAGPNLRRALAAYLQGAVLDAKGNVDDATWQKLIDASGVQQPLVSYEITAEEVAGPFAPQIPADLPQQASLASLDYTSPLEMIGERFHASPALLKKLNPGATFSRPGERIQVPNVEPFDIKMAAPGAKVAGAAGTLKVRKATSTLTIEDDSGKVLVHAPVTVGSEHDPLPVGTWKVTGVQRMPKFHYNPSLFWDADPSHSKATIQAGANNPVGIVWIDLSKPHYGIHGTPEPGRIGHAASHGCVRLTNWDALRVAQLVKPGTKVIFE
jgi:lipoprotein-anchoring transpeptidase ErfK/SrfK